MSRLAKLTQKVKPGKKAKSKKSSDTGKLLKVEDYKGYQMHINEIVNNPNGQKSQTVLIYKDGKPVGSAFADLKFENAIEKAKSKIDNYFAKGGETGFFTKEGVLDKEYYNTFTLAGNGKRKYNIFQSHTDSQLRQAAKKLFPGMAYTEHQSRAKHMREKAQEFMDKYIKSVEDNFQKEFGRPVEPTDYKVSGIWTDDFSESAKKEITENLSKYNAYKSALNFHNAVLNKKDKQEYAYAKGGRTHAAIAADKDRKAMHPGRRVSASGNVYHENRANRSDTDRRKKFESGGPVPKNKVRCTELPGLLKNMGVRMQDANQGNDNKCYIDVEEQFWWGAETKNEYNNAQKEIDNIKFSGKGWNVYAWYDISGFEYWMKQQQEQNYIQITLSTDEFVDKNQTEKIYDAIDNAIAAADAIANKYSYNPYVYEKGGKVVGGYTLYRFVNSANKGKSLQDFLTQYQDGLSKSIHKGYLVVVIGKDGFYHMRFKTSSPDKWKHKKDVIAYVPYPDNKKENIVIVNSNKIFEEGGEVADDLLEFTIPDWALSALINADESGLTDEEQEKLNEFVEETVEEYGNANFMLPEEEKADLGFRWRNDIDGALGGNCHLLYLRPSKEYAKGGTTQDDRVEEILRHYVTAALWSSSDMDKEDEMLDANYSFEDVSPELLDRFRADIRKFITENDADIKELGLTDDQVGHSLWLSQNRHGAGFFDYSGEEADRLQKEAIKLGSHDLYVGDDGKIYSLNSGINNSSYAAGGKIKNQYKGKNDRDVWKEWTQEQRKHFLSDHLNAYYSIEEIDDFSKTDWYSLPKEVQIQVNIHMVQGQYAKGGKTMSLDKIKNQYNGWGAKDVWQAWDYDQRQHFIQDHFAHMQHISHDMISADYDDLPKMFTDILQDHVRGGQYAKGGSTVSASSIIEKYKGKINSRADIKAFFVDLYKMDIAFHPDDDFADIVNLETDKHVFSKKEAADLNKIMQECFAWSENNNEDLYEIGISVQVPEFVKRGILPEESMYQLVRLSVDGSETTLAEFIEQNEEMDTKEIDMIKNLKPGESYFTGHAGSTEIKRLEDAYAKGGMTDDDKEDYLNNFFEENFTYEQLMDKFDYLTSENRDNRITPDELENYINNNLVGTMLNKHAPVEYVESLKDLSLYAKGGKISVYDKNFKEIENFGDEDVYYVRDFSNVIIGDKEIRLAVVANIRNLENYMSDEELPVDGNFELNFNLVPYEKYISKKHKKSASDSNNSISGNVLVDIVNYMGGLRYNPSEKNVFKTFEDAEKHLMSKSLNDQISADSALSGFILDRSYNRMGQTNWDYLSYMTGDTERFSKGGKTPGRRKVVRQIFEEEEFDYASGGKAGAITAADEGNWVDGNRGIYQGEQIISIAERYGFVVKEEDQANKKSDGEFYYELVDEAIEYLNELAPEGYYFGNTESGDFGLWKTEDEEFARGGRTRAAIAADKDRKAMHPGRRVSASGNVYHENRANRSDADRRRKFAKGGNMEKTQTLSEYVQEKREMGYSVALIYKDDVVLEWMINDESDGSWSDYRVRPNGTFIDKKHHDFELLTHSGNDVNDFISMNDYRKPEPGDEQILGWFKNGSRKLFAAGGSTGDLKTLHNGRYLTFATQGGKLHIFLTDEGREWIKENGPITYQNFWELFDDITGNSELLYFNDIGDAGFGLTSAPGFTDGYFYNDKGELEEHESGGNVWWFEPYQVIDPWKELTEKGEVDFDGTEGNKLEDGGQLQITEKKKNLFYPGDLVWDKNAGQSGLVGLVVSEPYEVDGELVVDILYRGYSGDIYDQPVTAIEDILPKHLYKAEEKSDIDMYESIAKKRGLKLNPKYKEFISENDEFARGGRTRAAIAADKDRKAMHPGRRVSADGNVYYENRANRSDADRRRKFAAGGLNEGGYSFLVRPVSFYNRGASEREKFYLPGREGDDDGLRKKGYVLQWSHIEGGKGAKYFKDREAANIMKQEMIDKEQNKKFAAGGQIGSGKNGYIAFYKGKQVEVLADTSYQAQETAAKHFKARKSYEVTVVLAEKDGKQVSHIPDFARGGQAVSKDVLLPNDDNPEGFAKGGDVDSDIILLESVDKMITEYNYHEGENPDTTRSVFYESEMKEFKNYSELFDYLDKTYGLSSDPKHYLAFEDGRLTYNQTEDAEGSKASKSEIERFKKGLINLYTGDYNIYLSRIKKSTITTDEMAKWGAEKYEKGGQTYANGGTTGKPEMIIRHKENGKFDLLNPDGSMFKDDVSSVIAARQHAIDAGFGFREEKNTRKEGIYSIQKAAHDGQDITEMVKAYGPSFIPDLLSSIEEQYASGHSMRYSILRDVVKNIRFDASDNRIPNTEAQPYVENMIPFKGNNLEGKRTDNGDYVVLSFGHYPIWYYNARAKKWYGNADKYSQVTAMHISQTRPNWEAEIIAHPDLLKQMRTDETKFECGGMLQNLFEVPYPNISVASSGLQGVTTNNPHLT